MGLAYIPLFVYLYELGRRVVLTSVNKHLNDDLSGFWGGFPGRQSQTLL